MVQLTLKIWEDVHGDYLRTYVKLQPSINEKGDTHAILLYARQRKKSSLKEKAPKRLETRYFGPNTPR